MQRKENKKKRSSLPDHGHDNYIHHGLRHEPFMVEVNPSSIELRFADRDGNVFQVPRTINFIELLDGEHQ